MSIREQPMYSVHCDHDGCTYTTRDYSEFSGWADKGYAEEEWDNADNQIVRNGAQVSHYCYEHRRPICDECQAQGPTDDDNLCPDCTDNGGTL